MRKHKGVGNNHSTLRPRLATRNQRTPLQEKVRRGISITIEAPKGDRTTLKQRRTPPESRCLPPKAMVPLEVLTGARLPSGFYCSANPLSHQRNKSHVGALGFGATKWRPLSLRLQKKRYPDFERRKKVKRGGKQPQHITSCGFKKKRQSEFRS